MWRLQPAWLPPSFPPRAGATAVWCGSPLPLLCGELMPPTWPPSPGRVFWTVSSFDLNSLRFRGRAGESFCFTPSLATPERRALWVRFGRVVLFLHLVWRSFTSKVSSHSRLLRARPLAPPHLLPPSHNRERWREELERRKNCGRGGTRGPTKGQTQRGEAEKRVGETEGMEEGKRRKWLGGRETTYSMDRRGVTVIHHPVGTGHPHCITQTTQTTPPKTRICSPTPKPSSVATATVGHQPCP